MFKFTKKSLVAMCMAIVLTIVSAVPTFAVEVPTDTLQIVELSDNEATPYGTLSGETTVNVSGNGSGEFYVNVNGSWSPWAHCTLITKGFSYGSKIKLRVCFTENGEEKIGEKLIGWDNTIKDIIFLNAFPGLYTVYVTIEGNSDQGQITCKIY